MHKFCACFFQNSKIKIGTFLCVCFHTPYLCHLPLGGDMMPLLDDILYPNEKDLLAEKYRMALDSVGTVVRNMPPKQKGKV